MKNILITCVICIFSLGCKTEKKSKQQSDFFKIDVIHTTLKDEQLQGKTAEELRILRNEIFARKGYVFKDTALQNFFLKKEWYSPKPTTNIMLSAIEKTNIQIIKQAEAKFEVYKTPTGYTNLDQISKDFDGDTIDDSIILTESKTNNEKVLFTYLSKSKKQHKVILDTSNEYKIHPKPLSLKKNKITFSFFYPGTAAFYREFSIKFNPNIKDFQLCTYASSHRIMYGHIGKEYNMITGDYAIIKNASTIDKPEHFTETIHKGKQETKIITLDSINESLYEYFDSIGNAYEENSAIDEYGDDITDCRKEIIRKLKLEFTYGALNYLGEFKIFEKELKDFVKGISLKSLPSTGGLKHTKSYVLHRDWNLKYIKEDECKDELFFIYNANGHDFILQINNCALVKEEGKVIHTSEQSIIFEFNIGKNCSFTFNKITGAG